MAEDTAKKRRGERKTILVVEDNNLICEVLSECLERAGYAVVTAADGKIGWKEYREAKPDLVITDLWMPEVDGFTLVDWIRNEDSSVPIAVITGLYSRREILLAGGHAALLKPFYPEELLRTVKELLAKSPQELEYHRLKNLVTILIDQNKELEREVKELSRESKRAHSGKEVAKYETVIASFAHSLKGEFLHIGTAVRNLGESVVNSPDAKEECDLIERSIEYARLLLLRLLGYLELGALETEPVDAAELLKKAQLLAEPRLPSNIRLKVETNTRMKKQTVSANPDQLLLVVMELVNNSKNALKESPGTIELRLQSRIRLIALSVKDNGPGIPRSIKKDLLNKEVPSKSGLGLGLFLSNKLIWGMGGKMSVKSSSKSGTTVTILLPKASEKERP